MKRIKSYSDILNEIYGRSPIHAARGISQRIASKGIGLAAKAEDEDPEYHREQAEQLKSAIANNPSWAHLMLPKMQERLAYHEKRHVELMAAEEKSKDRANARKEESLDEGKFDTQVASDEFDRVGHHMASKDLNVTHVFTSKATGGKIVHVRVNNLPEDKNKMVSKHEFSKAEEHLKKLGDNYSLHTNQKISTTVGGK